ncbi:MAG: glycine cleavage system aminomethyltransferase GcvT [Pseudorhodoplanes sp.]
MASSPSPSAPLLHRTPLHALHLEQGGRMVPFAGYDMPVQYRGGIVQEHLQTRKSAGLFDVSHMGQLALRPRSGNMADVAAAIETLVPIDVAGLGNGRQRYGFFTNANGGILDDLMIANRGDHFFVVVNASRKDDDEAHLRAHLSSGCMIERLDDRALVALQGPAAEAVLRRLGADVGSMRFLDVRDISVGGIACVAMRSGYTGEDGFELSVAAAEAEKLARLLLKDADVGLAGLGARDSLRLEAGLCLYGSDIDETTSPIEAALEWAIQKSRRAGGVRSGGFPGADRILREMKDGAPRRRVGLKPDGRAPIRGGTQLFRSEQDAQPIGRVTSGGFGPSLNAPMAMGYVTLDTAKEGTTLFADLRGKRVPVQVARLPFVETHYKRD